MEYQFPSSEDIRSMGLTLDDLSGYTDVPRSTINRFYHDANIGYKEYVKLCQFYNQHNKLN